MTIPTPSCIAFVFLMLLASAGTAQADPGQPGGYSGLPLQAPNSAGSPVYPGMPAPASQEDAAGQPNGYDADDDDDDDDSGLSLGIEDEEEEDEEQSFR